MKKFSGWSFFIFLIFVALSGWFFTLLVDISMLIVLGFTFSFILYRVFVQHCVKSLGVYSIFLLPINIIVLYLGGVLPYFNLISPERVYFNILPKEWLGVSGNDFMWNGLLLPIIGRIIPQDIIPTTRLPLFTGFAFFIWLSYIPILALSSGYGFAVSALGISIGPDKNAVAVPWHKIFFPKLLKICLLALLAFILVSSLALGIARIYA